LTAPRILVVDNDLAVLATVSLMLKQGGYEVLSTGRPRRALEMIATPPPVDLVVSDDWMLEMPGTRLVREIVQRSPHTSCMLMTAGIIDPADVPEGVAVINKPFKRGDLISAVQSSLARSAELTANLRRERELSAELRQKSRQLRNETAKAIGQAREILQRSAPDVKRDQSK
jgi:DNA-binding NtrC family response regulator